MMMKPPKTFTGGNYFEKKNIEGKSVLFRAINVGCMMDKDGINRAEYINYLRKCSSSSSRLQKKLYHAVMSNEGKTFSHEKLAVDEIKI
jgi:hypothetical protein